MRRILRALATVLLLGGSPACNLSTTQPSQLVSSAAPTAPTSALPIATPTPSPVPSPLVSPQILGSSLVDPFLIAVDSTSVYFLARGSSPVTGLLGKVPLAGGATTILATGLHSPSGLAVTANYVYWTEQGTADQKYADGTLNQIGIGGGTVTPLALQLNDPLGITVDSLNVYWSEGGGGQVRGMPLAGGPITAYGQGLVAPDRLASDGRNVIWAEEGAKRSVTRKPINSAPAVALATLPAGQFQWLAVDPTPTNLYWLDAQTGTAAGQGVPTGDLQKVPLAGGTSVLLVSGLLDPRQVAVDSTNVYWLEAGSSAGAGLLRRVPLAGGSPQLLAASLNIPNGLALDATSVYWTEEAAGLVRKLAK